MATFGYTSIGASDDAGDSNRLRGCKFTLSEAASVTAMHFAGWGDGAARNVKVAIYDDDGSGGAAGTLLYESTTTSIASAYPPVWYDFAISGNLTAGNYWLCWMQNGNLKQCYDDGGNVMSYDNNPSTTYPDLENPVSGMVTWSKGPFSIYATYTVASSGQQLFTLINEMGY
jgi:hypothetical protein